MNDRLLVVCHWRRAGVLLNKAAVRVATDVNDGIEQYRTEEFSSMTKYLNPDMTVRI